MSTMHTSTATSRFERGLQSQEVGDHEEALFEFTKAIFLNPNEPAYYKARADTYLYMCDFKVSLPPRAHACALSSLFGVYNMCVYF
jgi:Tfp pilus assembly protein PilF